MIEPTKDDIGRRVVYQAWHPGAVREDGVITSFNKWSVFVRYGSDAFSKATSRCDLEWLSSNENPMTPAPQQSSKSDD